MTLQRSASHDHSEISLIYWFGAQEINKQKKS